MCPISLGTLRYPYCCALFLPPDSQRSHLSSFTMKLMDKFHSPKIKRTPSKKGKQPDVVVSTPEKVVNKVNAARWMIDLAGHEKDKSLP